MVARLIRGDTKTAPFTSGFVSMCELGWKALGVLELTARPSIQEDAWVSLVQETDALLVEGGDPLYLCYWMRQSGLADLLPSLRRKAIYVGLSAGSMVMVPSIGEDFVGWNMPDNSLANAEKLAAGMPVPAYLIDDQTAIRVVDGAVDVVSEGHWMLFAQEPFVRPRG